MAAVLGFDYATKQQLPSQFRNNFLMNLGFWGMSLGFGGMNKTKLVGFIFCLENNVSLR